MTPSRLDSATGAAAAPLELADVVAAHAEAFVCQNYVSPQQRKVLAAIENCRTVALGGTRYWCAHCGFERYVYHSCRNRHCPKCQTLTKERWLRSRKAELLPVPYFHNVFTLPHEINPLILWSENNQRRLLSLLFGAASQTLQQFGKNHLRGQLGFVLVLHTWDQQLRPHFHLHGLIAGGALGNEEWIPSTPTFLFPVRALSKVFRGKFLAGLECLLQQGKLDVPPALQPTRAQRHWLRRLRRHGWIVYSKAPFAGPGKLLDYLGRYTHKTAISNCRLVALHGDQVTFTWRDRADGDRRKLLTLPAAEFLRRFLSHVLPKGFMRIRQFGFLANRCKQQTLRRCREYLAADPPQQLSEKSFVELMLELTGINVDRCPHCGRPLYLALIGRHRNERTRPMVFDSS